ncbi:MAG: TRAP transporter small permease subunit [Proteobacteria bacterium]|nr:TRAP transporter small permease subunit [Pseudomonadota bacterium]MDA0928212.1 TRAP transporter small permease subunit [Pseudomonadota bacterium]
METVVRYLDALSERLGRSAAWLSLLMVLVMGLIVLLRYVFQYGSIALQESVMYINALIFTFGAGYTLKVQGHVRVDVFYNRLGEKSRSLVDCFGVLAFLFTSVGFVIWASWDYVAVSWRIREGSPESSGLPYVYLLKTCLLILPTLLALQGVAELWKSFAALRSSTEYPQTTQTTERRD